MLHHLYHLDHPINIPITTDATAITTNIVQINITTTTNIFANNKNQVLYRCGCPNPFLFGDVNDLESFISYPGDFLDALASLKTMFKIK